MSEKLLDDTPPKRATYCDDCGRYNDPRQERTHCYACGRVLPKRYPDGREAP